MSSPLSSPAASTSAATPVATSAPLNALFAEFMSRSETEKIINQTLDTIQQLDKTVIQHQIVRDTTNQQAQQQHQQTFAESAQSVHMDDVNTVMPQSVPSSASTHSRTPSPAFINITPPVSGVGIGSPIGSPSSNPRSPIGPRSPNANGISRSLHNSPHPLDPTHLQVDEVSLRASPTHATRRMTPIDAYSPGATPSPPGSPLASPNSMRKRLNKPLNLPSSPRLTSPSPPRSPARHISSPLPAARSPRSIPRFYYPDGMPATPRSKKRELDLIERLWNTRAGDAKPTSDGMTVEQLFSVTRLVCGFSSYCNSTLFDKLIALQNELRPGNTDGVPSVPAVSAAAPGGQPEWTNQPTVLLETFLHYHAREIEPFDLHTRFFRLLRSNDPATGKPRNYLIRDDFKPIVQEIVNRHPGLEFLESTPEFQLKYAQTVIARIFYAVNESGNEQLTLRELKASNFLLVLALLDQEDDINKLNDFFSYEHFYVIYCKFWELDEDHDGYIDGNDLIGYDDWAMTSRVVDRIMAGAGRKFLSPIPNKMSYLDFVVFLISEVDKTSDVSLNYFFNVIDLDCDGIISTYEIQYFFDEQKHRIQNLSQELITFPDIMCQLIDMVQKPLLAMQQDAATNKGRELNQTGELRLKEKKMSYSGGTGGNLFGPLGSGTLSSSQSSSPHAALLVAPSPTLQASTFHSHHKPFQSSATYTPTQGGSIYNVNEGLFYRKDLKESKMASQFFATLFNLSKFVQSEQRDPIRIKQIHDTPQLSDWDRYAISGHTNHTEIEHSWCGRAICYYRLAELPEANDSAAAWADMSDSDQDLDPAYQQNLHANMEVDHQGRKDTK